MPRYRPSFRDQVARLRGQNRSEGDGLSADEGADGLVAHQIRYDDLDADDVRYDDLEAEEDWNNNFDADDDHWNSGEPIDQDFSFLRFSFEYDPQIFPADPLWSSLSTKDLCRIYFCATTSVTKSAAQRYLDIEDPTNTKLKQILLGDKRVSVADMCATCAENNKDCLCAGGYVAATITFASIEEEVQLTQLSSDGRLLEQEAINGEVLLRNSNHFDSFNEAVGEDVEETPADEATAPGSVYKTQTDENTSPGDVDKFVRLAPTNVRKNPEGHCLFELGRAFGLARRRPELQPRLDKLVMESIAVRMLLNLDPLYEMLETGDKNQQMYAEGLIAIVKLMSAINEKSAIRTISAKEAKTEVVFTNTALLDPDMEVHLKTIGGQEFSLNRLLYKLSSGTYPLRTVIHDAAHHILTTVLNPSEYVKYSMSSRARAPQITFPDEFVNVPIAMIVNCLECAEFDSKELLGLASSVYRTYFTNKFNQARSAAKSRKRKADESSPTTTN